eukprot:3179101-Pleurochrysis_carterae.AAC.1
MHHFVWITLAVASRVPEHRSSKCQSISEVTGTRKEICGAMCLHRNKRISYFRECWVQKPKEDRDEKKRIQKHACACAIIGFATDEES